MANNQYQHIPQEKFAFAQLDAELKDKKLETKARGYMADAMLRFKKNKSSVVAAYIILLLVLFVIVSPILSPYQVKHMDKLYMNHPPFVRSVAEKKLGILDGGITRTSQNDASMDYWRGIAQETGMDPVIEIVSDTVRTVKQRGKMVETHSYTLRNNNYYETGNIYLTLSYDDFNKIQAWQNETGIQVIFPWVETKDIKDITNNPNLWYKVKNAKGEADKDDNGNFIPAYSTNKSIEGAEYNSLRIAGDDGSYIYSARKSGAVQCRVNYYNYYTYINNGLEPTYLMGTNAKGQDMFCAIGMGGRFSLVFAVLVSAINLTIGAIYGAIQGYYGGTTDLVMDRIADILSGIPFTVAATLFQLHLAQKVGTVPSFLFAFVMTGWIGMSALTRKQFYRFKGQEYVLAARTLGASDWRLMFRHIFPNSLGTIVTSCALVIPGVISSETSMTYLGIVNLSELVGTSIGELMSQGQTAMTSSPHAMLFPALFFSLLMISFNLFGNGLRDAFNPTTRGED
ncbi:MAG: ABC transporter permease [Clostridiales bacterium]|nr:ABC transporter permease [Clostridiales bacterium]